MESGKLARLSELTAISRRRELTEAEKTERETLRNEYRAAVTGSLRADLQKLSIVEPDGTVHKVVPKTNGSGKNSRGEV